MLREHALKRGAENVAHATYAWWESPQADSLY